MRRKLYGATTRQRLEYHREVDENGCWNWPGTRQSNGYGRITVAGRPQFVHRIAYVEFTRVGAKPASIAACPDSACRYRTARLGVNGLAVVRWRRL